METGKKEKQRELEQFVSREIGICQSALVSELLRREVFAYEDIENLSKTRQELLDEGYTDKQIDDGGCDSCKEVYEWWTVGEWLAKKLEEQGEPILSNDYGTWWGRCASGQSISIDGVIEAIYDDLIK